MPRAVFGQRGDRTATEPNNVACLVHRHSWITCDPLDWFFPDTGDVTTAAMPRERRRGV
jgi:hypothetical protein